MLHRGKIMGLNYDHHRVRVDEPNSNMRTVRRSFLLCDGASKGEASPAVAPIFLASPSPSPIWPQIGQRRAPSGSGGGRRARPLSFVWVSPLPPTSVRLEVQTLRPRPAVNTYKSTVILLWPLYEDINRSIYIERRALPQSFVWVCQSQPSAVQHGERTLGPQPKLKTQKLKVTRFCPLYEDRNRTLYRDRGMHIRSELVCQSQPSAVQLEVQTLQPQPTIKRRTS